jgi:SAM-dependent methyltransferase
MPRNRAQLHHLVQSFSAEAESFIEGLGEPHPFIARLLRSMDWRPKDFKDFVIRKHAQFERSFVEDHNSLPACGQPRIQKLTHKIWLTSAEGPHLPPAEYLASYFAMCKGQPAEWTHFFWSNSTEVLRHVSELAIADDAKIHALDTHSLQQGPIATTLGRLIGDRKFVLAADVLKFVVLDRHGGIYSDMGIHFDDDMLEIAVAADFGFLLASNMFFQTSWISLAKGSLLSTAFLGILNNPEAFSADYALDRSRTVSAGTEVHTFAGLGYTVCALLFMPSNAKMFAFPQSSAHLTWRAQQSWYGDAPKHGNVLINETQPSVMREERYAAFSSDARQRLRTFNANGRLNEMARIVIKLFDYFQANPTSLSERLAYNGSDKVGAWHNYGYLYTFLLGIFVDRGCALLEIGDALSLWGKLNASDRSLARGGAIQVWKEYLGASTFGVEIERSEKREFPLSQPVLINGADRVTLEEQLARQHYDVIIDNGPHYFEATVSLLESALARLRASGVYVIEAVPLSDIERWEAYLSAAKLTALLAFLPHPLNESDNCLIAIFNTAAHETRGLPRHVFAFPKWTAPMERSNGASATQARITYSQNLQSSRNIFRDAYSSLSDDDWKALWLSTESGTNISDIEFPAIPDRELQLQIHGSSSWEMSITEAFDFYRFVKSKVAPNAGPSRLLDYGCGWGRMMRPFMKDFDLDKIFGFEPNLLLATIARSLNPYVCVLSGGYTPDGSIPKGWFDLVIGWSIFSHLSKTAFQQWLGEIAQVLKPGGTGVFTTWGMRFLLRLRSEQQELKDGKDIHWYSKMCIETAGDLSERIAQFERGDFVWFTNTDSTLYGEAFVGEAALREIIEEGRLPLEIVSFDTSSLYQDAFIVRRQ